jgi:hypothetical protein
VKSFEGLPTWASHHATRPGRLRSAASTNVVALPERFRPAGVAMLLGHNGFARVYLCDRKNHFVDVVDQEARPLFSFGGLGERPGQFKDPCDIVVIPPADQASPAVEHALVAVADRGNGRVQIFDPMGTLVALLAPFEGKPRQAGEPELIRTSVFGALTRLAWVPPVLVARSAQREVLRIDLGRAFAPIGQTMTARSSIRGVLRRVLADHPSGMASRGAGSPAIFSGGALRPPS